jgi:hypothetical protein
MQNIIIGISSIRYKQCGRTLDRYVKKCCLLINNYILIVLDLWPVTVAERSKP